MTNYSENDSQCRVEIWRKREAGLKWYTTLEVEFRKDDFVLHPSAGLRHALEDALDEIEKRRLRFAGTYAVCDEPWSAHSHPVCVEIPERWDELG